MPGSSPGMTEESIDWLTSIGGTATMTDEDRVKKNSVAETYVDFP